MQHVSKGPQYFAVKQRKYMYRLLIPKYGFPRNLKEKFRFPLVLRASKHDHGAPLLKRLHWLPAPRYSYAERIFSSPPIGFTSFRKDVNKLQKDLKKIKVDLLMTSPLSLVLSLYLSGKSSLRIHLVASRPR